MITEVDERQGIVKTYWKNIRNRLANVEPEFVKLADELNLDKTFPFYLVYFPYGDLKGDTESSFIPKSTGGYYRLSDPNAPADIIKHLGYGKSHAPLGMVLEKNFELYIDLKNEKITLPEIIYTPGSFLSLSRNLDGLFSVNIISNKTSFLSSGVRSTFKLPNIGCFTNHKNLQRDFNVRSESPKSLYDHWNIFKEITNSKIANSDWRSCLIYFPEKFVYKLNHDLKWIKLNNYLCKAAFKIYECEKINYYFEFIFSIIQKKRNLKPNPYLIDTVKHLLITALGVTPGYKSANNNDSLPLDIIQKAYIESYGLKNYLPTVIQPAYYNYKKNIYPIYYSLQYPSTHSFSPKSRKISTILSEMREIEYIISSLLNEFSKDNFIGSDTVLHELSKKVEFQYFHNEHDQHNIIKHVIEMPKFDPNISKINPTYKIKGSKFCIDSPFTRGCISINAKKNTG